ncbi:MAG: hypothetical protein EHM67_12685, partial [Hyphomicrobiaceae bacterium]
MTSFPNMRRDITKLDDNELRASLQAFGWIEQLPAVKDQKGNILIGHRRLRLAESLNIKPVVRVVHCDTDADRHRIATAANVGYVALSKNEREALAKRLYSVNRMTQEEIAKLLGVGQQQISRDLGNLRLGVNQKHDRTERNPRGAGRPKGSGTERAEPSKKRGPDKSDRAVEIVMGYARRGEKRPSAKALAAEHSDIDHNTFDAAIVTARWLLKREQEEPTVTLSATAQEKLDAAERAMRRRLEAEFHERVRVEVKRLIEVSDIPAWQQE